MKRIIFDLDGTLLTGSFDFEYKYFKDLYGENSSRFVDNVNKLLDEYEKANPRYDIDGLCDYLTVRSGFEITSDVIDGWNELVGTMPDKIEEGIVDTLEYLKHKDYSLAVLTNWFGCAQNRRLKRAGLLEYFDDVYTGEMVLKPHKDAYLCARDRFRLDDCVLIGDNVLKDYIAPRAVGMESILYDKEEVQHKTVTKVKRINELIGRF